MRSQLPWTTELNTGVSRNTVDGHIWDSVERATSVATHLYTDLFDRAPTSQEVSNIVTLMGDGGQSADAAYTLLASVEYNTLHSLNFDFVNALFEDVLHREASPLEAQQWNADIDGGLSREAAIVVFQNATEARNKLIDATYDKYLGEDPEDEVVDTWLPHFNAGQAERDLGCQFSVGQRTTINKARTREAHR